MGALAADVLRWAGRRDWWGSLLFGECAILCRWRWRWSASFGWVFPTWCRDRSLFSFVLLAVLVVVLEAEAEWAVPLILWVWAGVARFVRAGNWPAGS